MLPTKIILVAGGIFMMLCYYFVSRRCWCYTVSIKWQCSQAAPTDEFWY